MAQLLQHLRHNSALLDKISFAMDEATGGQMKATQGELLELLQICFQAVPGVYIVLDAIDECENSNDLVKQLFQVSVNTSTKVLLFSRPNVSVLCRRINHNNRLRMEKSSMEADIQLYLGRKVEMLLEDGLLTFSSSPHDLIIHLLQGADGMFLWARLMILYLNSPGLTQNQRVKAITNVNFPEGLDQMYQRILGLISQANNAERILAKKIFIWLTYARGVLNKRQLEEAVISGNGNSGCDDQYSDFNHAVIMCCAGLVEVKQGVRDDVETYFRFIHLSVQEFFSKQVSEHSESKAEQLHLIPEEIESHFEIARSCIFYLTFKTPAQPLSEQLGYKSVQLLDQSFPFLKYAAHWWVYHLHGTGPETGGAAGTPAPLLREILKTVSKFLQRPQVVMTWIEAFYMYTNVNTGFGHIYTDGLGEWANWAGSQNGIRNTEEADVCRQIISFAGTLRQLRIDWHSVLTNRPSEIWGQIPDFLPSRFLAGKFPLWLSLSPPSPIA
jgi:hypothetical protein